MIVAAGATHRQGEHAARHHVDAVVDDVRRDPQKSPAKGEKPHRREIARIARRLVRRDLQDEEPVVRQVLVEGPHHVIAVGVRPGEIAVLEQHVAFGVGVSSHVKPVTAPALAVVRRSQQPIDQPIGRVRSRLQGRP